MKRVTFGVFLGATLVVVGPMGCATTGGTAVERANAQCVAAVVVGGLLGAAIGNNTGGGNAGRGALIGAAAGGVACAILRATATEEDRRQMEATRVAALEAGEARTATYSVAGKPRTILVAAEAAEDPLGSGEGGGRICRRTQTSVTVQDIGAHTFDAEFVCRNPETLEWDPVQV